MRLGIALRLVGVLLLASLVIIEGAAVKNRAFEGKSEHYTVVLSSSADVNAMAADQSKHGIKVDHIVVNKTQKAFEASMTAKQATKLESTAQVSYIVMDSQKTVHHTWWDTTLITLGLRTPQLA